MVVALEPLRTFGERVRARREELGLSQQELGEIVGLHRTYIGSIERGQRNATLLNLLRVAEGLDMPIGDLIDL